MKIAVIGSDGQLGTDLLEKFTQARYDVYPLTIKEIQVENIDKVREVLSSIKPDVVLNTAAYHVVPKCEEAPSMAFAVNTIGALNVARVSADLDSTNVYYSTDYIFDGAKKTPYVESDLPNPLNVYAASKLAGEYMTLNYSAKGMVIRVSGIYGKVPSLMKGNNFITTMLKVSKEKPEVRVVTDEVLTPTPTEEIAEKTILLLGSGELGLFHLTSEGGCSWYEFAKVMFETLNIKTPLYPTTTQMTPSSVKRPSYSVLENSRYKSIPNMPEMMFWKDALISFLRKNYL